MGLQIFLSSTKNNTEWGLEILLTSAENKIYGNGPRESFNYCQKQHRTDPDIFLTFNKYKQRKINIGRAPENPEIILNSAKNNTKWALNILLTSGKTTQKYPQERFNLYQKHRRGPRSSFNF